MAPLLKPLLLFPLLLVSVVAKNSSETEGRALFGLFGPLFGFAPATKNPGKDARADFKTEWNGKWRVTVENVGVSAMQLQLMPNNKVVWFDTTALGDSARKLTPEGNCPINFEKGYPDCFAHALAYDADTDETKALDIKSDPWCSTGSLSAEGSLIGVGGYFKGRRAVRIHRPCEDCDFEERSDLLGSDRWYASQHILEDGRLVIVGGRKSFSYEIIPPESLNFPVKQFDFPFLQETTDPVENNLYPFLYLTPDGNLFLFANDRAIIFNPDTAEIIRELPRLPGGARNYPASGMSALLPIQLDPQDPLNVHAEVLICGGNAKDAFNHVDKVQKPKPKGVFLPALQDCGRISITAENPKWETEMMKSPRVMGDMLILPTGDLILLSGAKRGTSGWWDADVPNLTPELYMPHKENGHRFKSLKATKIPRMYHSSSALLPNGEVLVAGSNENNRYVFPGDGERFPTELRVEKFTPPYLDPKLEQHRPIISEEITPSRLRYGQRFTMPFHFNADSDANTDLRDTDLKVTMLSPPFTTHGYSQQQRMLVLGTVQVTDTYITVAAPENGRIAPPGYYMLFLVHRGVPSRGVWVQIKN
ncbi:hypothetical protein ACET3Z_027905 [Daucus carota]